MENLKIKVIVGFREDQTYIIEADEAHKAYYLFNNPEMRGVFNNGVALIGKNIQGIEPAYQETMGWNPSHKIDSGDWNEMRGKGIVDRLRDRLFEAKQVSLQIASNPKLLNLPLTEALSEIKQLS